MDYGKLAYLKAVDLESRLGADRSDNFKVSVLRLSDIPSGKSDIVTVEGGGDLAVFAHSSARATFFVDDIRACEGDNVFFKAISGGKISVSSSGLDSLELMLLGEIDYAEKPGYAQADFSDDKIAYVLCENGYVTTYVSDITDFKPTMIYKDNGVHGDICEFQGDFVTCITLDNGDVRMKNTAGKSRDYSFKASKAAVKADKYSITVAYISDGKLYYRSVEDFGTASAEKSIDFNGYIDDLRFVKKGSKLLFSSGGKCYMTDTGSSVDFESNLSLTMEVSLQ